MLSDIWPDYYEDFLFSDNQVECDPTSIVNIESSDSETDCLIIDMGDEEKKDLRGFNIGETKSRSGVEYIEVFNPNGKLRGYRCNSCDKLFSSFRLIRRHRKYTCGKAASLQCKYCSFACVWMTHLKSHMYKKHREQI